jgi:AraC family ethanolamine operon transcriptional activator
MNGTSSANQSSENASPGIDVIRIAADDPDELAAQVQSYGITVRHNQLSHGKFAADLAAVRLPQLLVARTGYATAITAHGAAPKGMCALALPIASTGECSFNHRPLGPGEIGMVRPGGEFTLVRSPGFRCAVAFADASLLERDLQATYGHSTAELSRGDVLRSDPGAVAAYARHLARICETARTKPKKLRNWVAARGGPARLAEELVDDLVAIVRAPAPLVGWSARHRLVNRAWEIVEDDRSAVVTVAELCGRLGVPIRTLDDAFRSCLGISPKRLILSLRLNNVRRALRQADERTTITSAATRHGFFHFGHFGHQYAQLFGERPSETLRRAAGQA